MAENLKPDNSMTQLDLFDNWQADLETEAYENEQGGRQTALNVRADLLPPLACMEISKILKSGAEKYGEHNWLNIPWPEQLNHAVTHVFKVMELQRRCAISPEEKAQIQDRLMLEAGQATCRMMFFLDMLVRERLTDLTSLDAFGVDGESGTVGY